MEKSTLGEEFISAEAKTPSPSDQRTKGTSPLYTILRPEEEDDDIHSNESKNKIETRSRTSDNGSSLPHRSRRKATRYKIDYVVDDDQVFEDYSSEPRKSSSRKKSRYADEDENKKIVRKTESWQHPNNMTMNDMRRKEKQKPTLKMASIESMFPSKDAKLNSKALLDLLKKPIAVKNHEDAKVRDAAVRMYISHVVNDRMRDKDSTPASENGRSKYNSSSPEKEVAFFI